MAGELRGARIAVLATDGVEDVEYTEPRSAVEQAGAQVDLVSLRSGDIQSVRGMDKAATHHVDATVEEADPSSYDALILPGGVANPDNLRTDHRAVDFVRSFAETGKPIGALCHGPWMLVEADVVREKTVTSWPSLHTDISNAGGNWVNREVNVDQGLITSRNPGDLPAFCAAIVKEFAASRHR